MPNVLATWGPVTHDFGLIQAPLELVVEHVLSWHRSIGIEYSRTHVASSLSGALESLLPLANSKMRSLFVRTRSNWIAYFQNGIRGSDPFPAMSYLAGRMDVLAMRICCTDEATESPATIWEVYSSQSPTGVRRSIAASNDGGKWIFEESGERYPFELSDRYDQRRKQERFTAEMLREYAAQFGIELFSDEFLVVNASAHAVRLERTTKVWHSPEFTLHEVIEGQPWRRG